MRTRDEHLEECKRQALAELDGGSVADAICVMLSRLRDHKETESMNHAILALGLLIATNDDRAEARRWIVGFR
jgi:hypothetical protein